MEFTFADIIVFGIIGISILFSFFFGFVWEVLFFGSWVGAGLAAYFGFPYVSPFVEEQIGYGLASDIITALVLFVAALIVLMILTQTISARVRRSGAVSIADRVLGLLFGAARGALVVIAIWLVIDYAAPKDPPATVRDAWSLPYVQQASAFVLSKVPQALRDRARSTADDTSDKAGAARDMMDAGRRLQGGDGEAEKGYKREDNRQLERMIENSTEDQ
ncbi:MAG: CvpA family protein [Minwuia sp.]|uniref:CvpA family protein n=1 Tax=Minwuia sp. TaxID=2493630 RepID=UPI003A88E688